MKTTEQIEKIKSIVLYVLKQFPEGLDYVKLSKILYFAQREYLATLGMQLLPETFGVRKLGPVPLLTYKVLKNVENGDVKNGTDLYSFEKSIKIENQTVYAKLSADMSYISTMEKKCLDKWVDYCRNKNSIDLSKESHDKVYKRIIKRSENDPELSKMTCIEIAESGNATEKIIQYIREKQLIFND